MNQISVRAGSPLRGRLAVPGDKSISHRALLLGAIGRGTSHVEGVLLGGDCLATLGAIQALGIEVEQPSPAQVVIHGQGLHGLREPEAVLDCRRSGTTLRLLAGLLSGQPFMSVLSGEDQLRRRPMSRVVEPLRRMGATVLARDGSRLPPLALQGGGLHGIDYVLPVASAQVKSALLLAGLFADGETRLHEAGPTRDHTERMLAAMGGTLWSPQLVEGYGPPTSWGLQSLPRQVEDSIRLVPGGELQPLELRIPGDISSAAFLLVAAALIPGSRVLLEGVGVNDTRTGLLDALGSMGAKIAVHDRRMVGGEPVGDLEVRASQLRGVELSGGMVVRAIDELPILAVAATQAEGETLVRDAAELRVKETDRIAATVEELRRLGAQIDARPDGFEVQGPTQLQGARVSSHGDHRLAMALTVAGLLATGETLVEDTACIGDSFPGFERALVELGAVLD